MDRILTIRSDFSLLSSPLNLCFSIKSSFQINYQYYKGHSLIFFLLLGVSFTNKAFLAVVAAQLVEQLLPTPEICGSNPISDTIDHYSTNCNLEKTKIKEVGNGPSLKK